MRITMLFCFVLFFFYSAFSQMILNEKPELFYQVKKHYLKGVSDTTNYPMPIIYFENILDTSQVDFGVFSFLPKTSNDKPQLFLKDYSTKKIQIITDYNFEHVTLKIIDYFRRNQKWIKYKQKLYCMEQVIIVLRERSR